LESRPPQRPWRGGVPAELRSVQPRPPRSPTRPAAAGAGPSAGRPSRPASCRRSPRGATRPGWWTWMPTKGQRYRASSPCRCLPAAAVGAPTEAGRRLTAAGRRGRFGKVDGWITPAKLGLDGPHLGWVGLSPLRHHHSLRTPTSIKKIRTPPSQKKNQDTNSKGNFIFPLALGFVWYSLRPKLHGPCIIFGKPLPNF
jgi:hypothetical protein